ATKPETPNPLVLWVNGHLISGKKQDHVYFDDEIPGKYRESTCLDQGYGWKRPVVQDVSRRSECTELLRGQFSLCSSRVTQPVPVAILQATRPDPVPGMVDATRPVTRSVPVAKHLDLLKLPPLIAPELLDLLPLNAAAAPSDPPRPTATDCCSRASGPASSCSWSTRSHSTSPRASCQACPSGRSSKLSCASKGCRCHFASLLCPQSCLLINRLHVLGLSPIPRMPPVSIVACSCCPIVCRLHCLVLFLPLLCCLSLCPSMCPFRCLCLFLFLSLLSLA
ncbi:hypothetical protein P4O66_010984, partial [Electrophorus voltai]